MAHKRGLDISCLNGAAINDVFVGYCLNVCSLPYTHPRDALKDWCDAVEHAILHMPNWFPSSIASYEMGESGATPMQQIAFTVAAAISYTRALMERKIEAEQIAPQYAVFLSCGNNFLEEVAKYRALRRMWAKTFREKFGVRSKRGLQCRIHTQTSGLTLRAEQPFNNIVRAALQSLSAIFGGTNSLYTDPYDEVLALPTEESHRLALRTQQIIVEETGVADTIDPLGGSYYVEHLTDKLEEEAWKLVDQVESMGGMIAAIEKRYFRFLIDQSYHRYLKAVERNEKVIVGYNKYRQKEEIPVGVFEITEELEEKQKKRLKEVKEKRHQKAVEEALDKIAELSAQGENVMEACIEATKLYATHEEIIKAICRPRKSYSEEYRIMSSKF
jgi:methylmalonyl-CoA mutase N-terminal domain/subunit